MEQSRTAAPRASGTSRSVAVSPASSAGDADVVGGVQRHEPREHGTRERPAPARIAEERDPPP